MSLPILQFANRLANATTSSDRISSLSDLQSYAKKNCAEVGQHTLQMVVDILKENGEADEYTEALDLISRLVNPRYGDAAKGNAEILLGDVMTVELLLDLLEHDDGLVAVMASEILTNIHSLEADRLEGMIQMCPAGMTKLLNRVPDRSREEVSNQAIILIQQLTVSNEEMKKAVAFNEGFDTLFGIIESEGGVSDPGAVVQDCLQICSNVLSDSETCQRLFFEMGGGWHFKLLDFFSPELLERVPQKPLTLLEPDVNGGKDHANDEDIAAPTLWFEQPVRLSCAIFAVKALLASFGSSSTVSKGVISVISSSADEIMTACAHWLIRCGPCELLPHCFSLMLKMVLSIDTLAARMFDILLKYDKTIPRIHTPAFVSSVSHLHFNWPTSSTGEKMVISFSCLLADRYIYPFASWKANSGGGDSADASQDGSFLAYHSLRVMNTMLQRDEMASGMILQHILAPPPPDELLDDLGIGSNDSPAHTEFGSAVLSTLIKSLRIIVDSQNVGGVSQSLMQHVDVAVRASNLLSLIFVHGGVLASELSTALSTSHITGSSSPPSGGSNNQPILPYLLSLISRIVRLPGVGYTVSSAVLRVLAGASSGCERASRQMLEDPSNLFVVELASRSSENAGVSQHMQVMCCLFLGCIFESFPKSDSAGSEGLSRNSVLGMIDSKIGLSRFSDLIKLPTLVKPARQQNSENGNYFSFSDDPDDIYFVEAYETFYKGQVHAIKKAIYDFYSGSGDEGVENDNLSAEAKIIKMQTETISELEMELTAIKSNVSENTSVPTCTDDSCTTVNDLQAKLDEKETENAVLRMNDTELRDQLCALSAQLNDLQEKYEDAELKRSPQDDVANNSALVLQTQLDSAELLIGKLELENTRLLDQERTLSVERSHLQSELSGKDTEIVHLKAEVLSLVEIRKSMTEDAAAVQRRLQLLEEDLKSPMPFEKLNEHKIDELEKRNADLKTQIWEMESSIKTMQSTFAAESKSAQEAAIDLINLLDAEVEKPDMQNLHDVLEVCGDVICRMAGHCSDIAESFDISFDSVEGKPRARVIECIDKLSECIRCNEMKILEGERFRSQLDAAEAELERVQEDYDAAFTRLCAVEEENANLSIANNKLFEGQSSRESVDIPGECSVTNGSVPETSEKLISELELKVTDLEMDLAAALRENEKLAHSHRELEVSTKYDREESKAAKDLASIEINRLLSENDKIKNLTAEHSDCSSKITELTVELNHYKGEYSRLLEENSANLALTSKLTQEYEQLQLDCDDRKKDYTSVESMSAMLEELRSDFRRLTEHSDALQHQKREVECRLNEHVNEHQQITSDNMQLRETIAAKADEYSSLLEKFIAQKEALVTASAEAELLKSKLDEQSLATDTTADIDSTAAGKIAGLNDVIRGLELEVDELCSEKEKLSSYYTSELQRVREDVEKLSQDANTRDDELAAAKREIATLQYGMRLESNTPDTVLAVGRRLAKLMKETVGGDGHSSYEESERVEALMNSSDSELLDTVNAMDRCLDVIFVQLKASAKSKENPETPLRDVTTTPNNQTPVRMIRPVYGGPTPRESSPATVRESVRLHTDLRKERSRLHTLQGQHSDLLGLLAQQEVELQIYCKTLNDIGGPEACSQAESVARTAVTERYGTYVNFREADEDMML